MLLLAIALALAIVYVVLRRGDRRMLRLGVVLFGAIFFGILGIVDVASHHFPVVGVLVVGIFLLMPIALVVLAGFLVANGVRMFRREGRSVGNMLSMLMGVVILGLVAMTILVLRANSTTTGTVFLLVVGIVAYFGVVFVIFLLYALVYGRIRLPARADVIVVLGSGLVRGQVSPLLRSRLDRAIGVYRRSVEAGVEPLMIPSGGQGSDEPRPEGAAMAEYLVAQGIPAARVRAEIESRNTRENLVLSRRVQQDAGVAGTVVVVTNNYHVMRSAMLARSLGSDAQVVGAPTARYYVPSAFLREFAAVLSTHRRAHLAVVVGVTAVWAFLLVVELVR